MGFKLSACMLEYICLLDCWLKSNPAFYAGYGVDARFFAKVGRGYSFASKNIMLC